MVKADMLYQLDIRLQEVSEKVGIPFGGVSIFAFGDIMQLKPCLGRYIFEKPINIEFHIAHSIEPRWYSFKVLNLKQNHRQGDDKPYADMLNRIRVGEQSNEDIKLLKTRVRPEGHKDLREASVYIVCKRKECALRNLKYLNSVKGELYKIKAIHHNATQKKYKPLIDHKDGAIARTSFMNELENCSQSHDNPQHRHKRLFDKWANGRAGKHNKDNQRRN